MSILSDIFGDIKALFFPPLCPVCGQPTEVGEQTICTLCRTMAPLTGFWLQHDNPVIHKFWGQLPLVHASGFLYFVHGSGWRELIHAFKYRGAWRRAYEMGVWYGRCLKEGGLYDDVEVVVPLPLHTLKLCRRGYNQSEYIARGIASELGVALDTHSIRRRRNTASQARLAKHNRQKNVAGAFSVHHPDRLTGRHILLIDDVLTTGSTLLSCAEEILRAAPDCRISIAVLAVPPHEVGIKE